MDIPQDNQKDIQNLFDAIKAHDSSRVIALIDSGLNVNVKDDRGRTALIIAAKEGCQEILSFLIHEVDDINETGEDGETALHAAAGSGHTGCVQKLIESHANMNVKNIRGESAVCMAAINGHLPCVRHLITAGAEFDLRDENDNKNLCKVGRNKHYECALHLMDAQSLSAAGNNENVHMALSYASMLVDVGHSAAARGLHEYAHEEIKHACLYYAGILSLPEFLNAMLESKENGMDVNRRDHVGYTCIYATAYCGNLQCVLNLIKAGADVNLRDVHQRSALSRSIANGHVDCIKALVDAGTDINVRTDDGITDIFIPASNGLLECMNILIEAGAKINVKDNNGNTPLFAATSGGHIDCVKSLINAGAEVNSRDNRGRTAMALAAENEFHECIQSLISAGGNIYLRDKNNNRILEESLIERYKNSRDFCDEEEAAIISAAWRGQCNLVTKLIANGVDVNMAADDGTTALIAAAWEGHFDTVDIILKECKVNVNASDCYQRTALFAASYEGHHQCVKRILAHEDVQVDKKTCGGITALMGAARIEVSDCLSELIFAGGNINAVDKVGRTPLIYAAVNGSEQCLLSLIDAGAIVDQADTSGKSALSRAVKTGRSKCVEILLEHLPKSSKRLDRMKYLLVHAASQHPPACLPLLLKAGIFNWSWYPWFYFRGIRVIVRELVIQGYSPSHFEWSRKLCTPLFHAIKNTDTGLVKYLMANLYLTTYDIFFLQSEAKWLNEVYSECFTIPLRLEALCFLVISTSLKSDGHLRQEIIDNSILRQLLPEKFLSRLKFQNPFKDLCVSEWDNIHGDLLNLRKPMWPNIEKLEYIEMCQNCGSRCLRSM